MESLERFAEIRATIELGAAREVALREAGLSPAEWIQLQRRWLGELAAEIAGGGDELAGRYWRAFQAAQPGTAGAELPASHVEPPAAQAAMQTPSYLRPVPIAAAPARPIDLRGTSMAMDLPARPALPFRGDQPTLPAASPARSAASSPHLSTGTLCTPNVPLAPATPFDPQAPSRPASLSGTACAPDAPAGPATPFQAVEPAALGFSLLRYAELVAARDEAGADRAAVLTQFSIDETAHARIEAHWKHKTSTSMFHASNFVTLLGEAKKALAERRTAPKTASVGSGTVLDMDLKGMAAGTSGIIAAAPPDLDVNQYAWLVATLRKTAPADVPATLVRMRLTPDTRRALEERWAKRMAADPTLRETFLRALGQHMAGGCA